MTANADTPDTDGDRRHLPECDTPHNGLLPCICESLRACEKRIRDEERERARQIVKETLLVKSHGFPDYDYYEFAAQTLQDCNHEIASALRDPNTQWDPAFMVRRTVNENTINISTCEGQQ